MKVAILGTGPSLRDQLPFDRSPYDIVVVINHAGELVPNYDHWAAIDWEVARIRKQRPHWRIDWSGHVLRANSTILGKDGALTLPATIEKVIQVYDPEQIDVFGVDMDGRGVGGSRHKANHWDLEKSLLSRLDLSRVNWRGKWQP